MSMRYKGGVISATPPTTSSSSAVGIWTLEQQLQATSTNNWPLAPVGWITSISALGYSGPPSVITDASYNVYIAGRANNGYADVMQITKLNEVGAITWQRTLGVTAPTSTQYGAGIVVDTSSNVYVCGADSSGSYGIVAKYNSSGTLQWQRQLGTVGNTTQFYRIAIDSSANLYISGYNITGSFLCKYNSSGALQWQKQLNAGGGFADICVDTSSNVYVTGTAEPNPNSVLVVQKYNSSGTLQWQRSLAYVGASGNIYGNCIAVDSSANVFVGGFNNLGSQQIVKYNTSGTIQWQKELAVFGTFPRGLTVDGSGNAYIIGNNGITAFDAQITKYDTNGTVLFQRSFGGSGAEYGLSVTTDALNNFYIYVNSQGLNGMLIAKLPGNGTRTGVYTVGGYAVTYASTSYVAGTTTLTDASTSYTSSDGTMAETAASLTSATSTLTSSNTQILGN